MPPARIDSLDHANLPAPQRHDESAGENPSVRVLVLPGDGRPGMLETLLCRTLTEHPVTRCVDDFLRCAEESGQHLQRRDKARAHAWLATQPLPHVSVGVAALKGYWDLDHRALEGVRRFLTALQGDADPSHPAAEMPRRPPPAGAGSSSCVRASRGASPAGAAPPPRRS